MSTLVRVKGVVDKKGRMWGGTLRLLGVDFSVMLLGWLDDWRLIDLRIPANYGVFLQVLFITASIGRLPDDYFQQD